MKKFLRNIFSKTGIGAPDLPKQVRLERVGRASAPLSEGVQLFMVLKPDSFEVQAFLESGDEDILVGMSHNYALSRYIMRYGSLEARVYSYSSSEIILHPDYNKRLSRSVDRDDDDFV